MKLIAPAKLNLYLHITGKRNDGYHELESLFVFTQFGDVITLSPANSLTITMDGPFHQALSRCIESNQLIYRAAMHLKSQCNMTAGVHIHLTKNIPIGAGLGGGSSDAATVLLGLTHWWQLPLEKKELAKIAITLGADVPACLEQQSLLVSGIGECITPCSIPVESLFVVLINPQISLETKAVFQHYQEFHTLQNSSCAMGNFQGKESRFSPSSGSTNLVRTKHESPVKKEIKPPTDLTQFLTFLSEQKNDLESSAIQLLPEIQQLLLILSAQKGCHLARMSGSGSTCFGLFTDSSAAKQAQKIIRTQYSNYWTLITKIL